MKDIDISVIIPIYNTPIEYLRKSIESVINQSYKNIEIIFIIDGKNQEIEETCFEYQKKDKRIKIITQENRGEGASRNKGIEVSKGKWICFVDSDDWIKEDTLEKTIEKAEQFDFDILIFDCYINTKNKEYENEFYNKQGVLSKKDIEEIRMQNIGKGITKYFPNKCSVSVVWAKLYKNKFIKENNLQFIENIKRTPDAIFNMYAFEKAKNIGYFNLAKYHYRQNEKSITNVFDINLEKDFDVFLKEVKKYIEKYKKEKKFLDTYYITILTKQIKLIEIYLSFGKFKEFENLIKNNKYLEELKKVRKEKLNIYQKLMLKQIKNKNEKMIKKVFKIKKIIKNIQRGENK